MIVLKSFVRNKSTKIYWLIYIILFVILFLLFSFYNNYMHIIEDNSKNNYIIFSTNENPYNKLKNISSIAKIEKDLFVKFEFNNYEKDLVLIKNNNLVNNEVVLPYSFNEIFNIKDDVRFYFKEFEYNFIVKDYNDNDFDNLVYISSDYYEKIDSEVKTKKYRVFLNNWLKSDKVISKITEKINLTNDFALSTYSLNDMNANINTIIMVINFSLIIMFIILFVFSIILTINLLADGKMNNLLLSYIGYDYMKIVKINILKFILLEIFSSINAFVIYYILKLFLSLNKVIINFDFKALLAIILLLFINIIINYVSVIKMRLNKI